MAYTVKAVSDLSGVSIRTLHHYDAIGLLKPTELSDAGYRLYSTAELERLQQVLFLRELGFRLSGIKEILDNPSFDRRQALLDHKQLLLTQQQRLGQLVQTIDRTLNAMERGIQMSEKEMFEGFDPAQYEAEAEQRWGHTAAWPESKRRTQQYTRADWDAIKKEGHEIEAGIAALIERSPSDPEVQAWIERHHRQINERFYTCSVELYRGLADLYVQDQRFTAHYEKVKSGLAQFIHMAMHIYCDRLRET